MRAQDFADYILIFNTAYSKKTIAEPPASLVPITVGRARWRGHRTLSLMKSMAASIQKEGLRNPIYAVQAEEGLFTVCGSRRVVCCKWLNLQNIPAVITDYTGKWSDLEELHTKQEILSKFRDPPEYFDQDDEKIFLDKLADSEAYTLR